MLITAHLFLENWKHIDENIWSIHKNINNFKLTHICFFFLKIFKFLDCIFCFDIQHCEAVKKDCFREKWLMKLMNYDIFIFKFFSLKKNMIFINCNKFNLSLKAWNLQNFLKFWNSYLFQIKKNICIYFSLNIIK